MPVRATKRGAERTPIDRDCDVLVCGASFAGLAVARALQGSGARVLIVDRYEVGERATSACAMPTGWMEALDLLPTERQRFDELVIHTQFDSFRYDLPWAFSTFDYRGLCRRMREQASDADFDTAKVNGITRRTGQVRSGERLEGQPVHTVHTDRGDLRAPLVVDALGWRRVLSSRPAVQPLKRGRRARLSRGLEVHPHGEGKDLEIWVDPRYVIAGYSWSFPADGELRVGVGSFRQRADIRHATDDLASELEVPAVRYQGNWIPHKLRPAIEDGVAFAGDSAGHCLPLTAEGIRTALYFGLACGRELRAAFAGRIEPSTALDRYAAFSDAHAWQFGWLLSAQWFVSATTRMPLLTKIIGAVEHKRVVDFIFNHYLDIAHPDFVAREGIAFGVQQPRALPRPSVAERAPSRALTPA
jgi:menaquinone-9 beta-reductase